jgi:hypothetical protein
MLSQLAAFSPPPSETIRQTSREVIGRPYFDLTSRRAAEGEPFIVHFVRWLLKPFIWLYDQMEGMPEALRWIIVAICVVVCLALIAHLIYTLAMAIRGPAARRRFANHTAQQQADPQDFERQAKIAQQNRDYISGIRLLFRAALRRLEEFEDRKFRPGITNRELLRRYRSTPLAESLTRFVNTIDAKWYGQDPCEQSDFIACQDEHGRICQYIRESRPADAT